MVVVGLVRSFVRSLVSRGCNDTFDSIRVTGLKGEGREEEEETTARSGSERDGELLVLLLFLLGDGHGQI